MGEGVRRVGGNTAGTEHQPGHRFGDDSAGGQAVSRRWPPTSRVAFRALGALRALLGLVEDFIRITAALIWGLMLFVYCLSHASFLLTLPTQTEPWVGSIGWFLYLILLTECNDIAQPGAFGTNIAANVARIAIGLQDHGNVVWFRNIKIRKL